MKLFARLAAFGAATSFSILPAFAHHPLGGKTPSTFMEGLLSGIGHPILGVDHLAFVIAIGLIALLTSRPFLMPLFYIVATMVGTGIHLMAIDLPLPEFFIALSVLVGGAFVARAKSVSFVGAAAAFSFSGLFHGFAYGEAIFGAEASPLFAYLVGFGAVQYAIAVGAGMVATMAMTVSLRETAGYRIAGGVVAGMGLMILSEQALAAVFG